MFKERASYICVFSTFISFFLYQIQETSAENVLHMSCQDVGPSGSSGQANQANEQQLFHSAVCDPTLHIGYCTCFSQNTNIQLYKYDIVVLSRI
jgi:hypothetical protein